MKKSQKVAALLLSGILRLKTCMQMVPIKVQTIESLQRTIEGLFLGEIP